MALRRVHWPPFALLIIVLLAAGLRFWKLDRLPPGLYHDEAYYGLDALSLRQGKTFPLFYEGWELYAQDAHADRPARPVRFPVFFEGNYGREPLHVYLVALSIGVFGPTPLAIRAVSAVSGTLAVLTTYLAAVALFPPDSKRFLGGYLLPLLAAFTLAVLYPALTFSRFGIRAMTMLPCVTMAVFAFWRGMRSESRRGAIWLAVAGFFTGLSLYTFASARLFPLVFILFGVYWLWRDRAEVRAKARGLLVAVVVATLTAAPLLIFFARFPYFFFFRIAYVANRGAGIVEGAPLQTWLLNIGRVVAGLFWRGETHLRHNLPGRPYLDPFQAILLAIGVWRGFRSWRRLEYAFLLIWFAVMLLPSILSGDAPHFGRLTGVAPPAAILVAVGATWLVEAAGGRVPQARWIPIALVALICATSLGLTVRDYFIRYASHRDLTGDFYHDDWEMGRFAASQPADTILYLSPPQEEMATVLFALADPDRLRSFNGETGLLAAGIPERPSLYLLRPAAENTAANLAQYFPDGNFGEPRAGYTPFSVGRDAERVRTEAESDADFGGVLSLAGDTIDQQPDSVDVTLTWRAVDSPPVNYTAFVHLIDQRGMLVAQVDRPPAGYPTGDWRPGELVVDTMRLDLPPSLVPGQYTLRTGFYFLPTMERLGEAFTLGEILIDE